MLDLVYKTTSQHIAVERPFPLYDPTTKIAVLFTAKSGSLFALEWFLAQTNQLQEARAYHNWLHLYRTDVLEKRPGYKENIHTICDGSYTIIRFVREPFSRAVSSFLHCTKKLTAVPPECPPSLQHCDAFTFRQFVRALSHINLREANSHYRLQIKNAEREKIIIPQYVVKIEIANEQLVQIENELGLPHTKPAIAPVSTHRCHYNIHRQNESYSDVPYNSTDFLKEQPWYTSYYDDELEQAVAKLYEEDFLQYNYSQSLKESMQINAYAMTSTVS